MLRSPRRPPSRLVRDRPTVRWREVALAGLKLPLTEALWLEQVYFKRNTEEAGEEISKRLKAFQERGKSK